MPRFAANLSMMFNELPFLDRFAAAADAGFEGVEFLFPYREKPAVVAGKLRGAGLEQVLFNMPPGDWERGERGIATLPGREREFEDGVEQALEFAEVLGCPRLHMMAGIPGEVAHEDAWRCYVDNLRRAAELAAPCGCKIMLEPINNRDMPGYFMNLSGDARRALEQAGADNTGLQFDLYQCQIMEGDLGRHLRELMPIVEHMQIAGVPGRHEPDVGEINHPFLFDLIDELGYEGWIGCEYRPRAETVAGLGWFERARRV
ncbi:MAG: 2-oxo-tetronate isomerase [Gammaproteobacteria bacterium]